MQKHQPKEDEEDYEDELQDQMAESLFQEADQMGIFQEMGVDYGAALMKIDEEIKKNKDKPVVSKPKPPKDEDE